MTFPYTNIELQIYIANINLNVLQLIPYGSGIMNFTLIRNAHQGNKKPTTSASNITLYKIFLIFHASVGPSFDFVTHAIMFS